MALNRRLLEERELAELPDREIDECKRLNRTLLYGFFLGTTLSIVPPAVMPVDNLLRDGNVVVRHKDPNVIVYSLLLSYLGMVAPFVYMETVNDKLRRSQSIQSQICAEINNYYRQEDSLDE